MEGTGEGNGWVGDIPCSGMNGGDTTPTDGIIGGVVGAGPGIPDG